jgi:hypothetical protein
MARKGLPRKYAKMGFAKGWKAYKASRRKTRAKPKTKKRKRSNPVAKRKKTTTKRKGVLVMATKRKRRKKSSNPGSSRKRRRVSLISPRVINILVDSGIIGGATLGATALVNMAPIIKDWPAWQKAIFQGVAGIFGISFARNMLLKKAFSGSIIAGMISLLIPFMPAGFKFAGARPLTSQEMAALAQMGKGVPIPANTMGRPTGIPTMGGNNRSRMSQR